MTKARYVDAYDFPGRGQELRLIDPVLAEDASIQWDSYSDGQGLDRFPLVPGRATLTRVRCLATTQRPVVWQYLVLGLTSLAYRVGEHALLGSCLVACLGDEHGWHSAGSGEVSTVLAIRQAQVPHLRGRRPSRHEQHLQRCAPLETLWRVVSMQCSVFRRAVRARLDLWLSVGASVERLQCGEGDLKLR